MSAIGGDSQYQPLRLLGRGGTAEVLAVALPDRRITAALKRPLPDSPDSQQSFAQLAAREALLIGRERFPGLVRLLEPPDSSPSSLLLEICPGPTLDRIGRVGDPSLLLNLLSALALDLAFLKARGIIHGDVKPHNYFLPTDWQCHRGHALFYAKLSDFSLGRFELEPESARAGAGTVGFMAPETILNGRTSHQSDLFALGVVAYQLATGRHPFMDEDSEPMRVNARVTEIHPQSIDDIRPDLPREFAELVASLLAKHENERPRTAFDVCCRLEAMGARYPFRTALRPTHLLCAASSFEHAISSTVSPELGTNSRLSALVERSVNTLRMILSANWRRGRLRFDGERFSAHGDLIWPATLRRKTLHEFSRLPLSEKRRVIVQSVIVSREPDLRGSTQTEHRLPHGSTAISDLLVHLLRPGTVCRIARLHASQYERAGNLANASRLYIMTGNLSSAARCACDASTQLVAGDNAATALRLLRRVISYAEMRGELFPVREALMLSGDALKQIGEADRALQVYHQIVALYASHVPDKLLGETYKDLGDLYKMRQDVRSGIESLERALAIYRELGDVIEISRTLNNLGNIYWINSNFDAALRSYRAALRIQRTQNLKPEIASTINNIASIYGLRSRFDRSIRLLNLSLALKKELGNAGEIARTLNNIGYVYAISGRTARSVESLRESLEINQRIGSRKEQLFNLENLSEASLQLGRVKESIQYLEEGLALAADLQDKPHLAVFHLTLTGAYLRLGRANDSTRAIRTVRSYLDQFDYPQAEPFYLLHTARIRMYIGDHDTALAQAMAAVDASTKLDDRPTCLQALLVTTRLSDDPDLFAQAESMSDLLSLKREKLLLAFNRVERFLERQDVVSAQRALDSAVDGLPGLEEDIELPRLHAIAAETCIESGNSHDALALLGKGLASATRMGLVPEITTILALRARIESANRAYEQCYATSRQALQMMRQLAENIENDDDRAIFLERRTVQNLMAEVRRLGTVLGQKQRAE